MHESLLNIQQQLETIIAALRASIPSDEPFGNVHGNWTFPGLTRVELIGEAQSLIDLINDEAGMKLETTNRGHVRQFDSTRKDTHWGKRKIKREQ